MSWLSLALGVFALVPLVTGHGDSCSGITTDFSSELQSVCSSHATGYDSPACTLWAACQQHIVSTSLCNSRSLFASLCTDNSSLSVCASSSGVNASECFDDWAYALPNTTTVYTDLASICTGMPEMGVCEQCKDMSCPDPFGSLAQACLSHDMADCSHWQTFCDSIGSATAGPLCPAASPPASCVTNPRDPSCSSYTYPDSSSQTDTEELCSRMPDMPTCYVRQLCKENKIRGGYCDNFVMLATMCLDMPEMSMCNNYNAMCGYGSVVKQCAAKPPIPRMPTSSLTRNSVLAACSDHAMPSCYTCRPGTGNCPNPLKSFVAVCNEHPSMVMCSAYHMLCSATGTGLGTICIPERGAYLPSMKMYFHQRVEEVILFREWISHTIGHYVGSIIAIMLFGIVSQALKVWRAIMEVQWATALAGGAIPPQPKRLQSLSVMALGMSWGQFQRNAIRALLTGVVLVLDYWNMLIVMTFNIGLIVAVIAGYMIGIFLFSHMQEQHALATAGSVPTDTTNPVGNIKGASRMEMGMCTCNS